VSDPVEEREKRMVKEDANKELTIVTVIELLVFTLLGIKFSPSSR